jgi:hypothetical protein
MLDKIGRILIKEGIPRGEISKEIAKITGMSYPWVVKYLPQEYKDKLQSIRAKSAINHIAGRSGLSKLSKEPREQLIKIGKYGNSDIVLAAIRKALFNRIEKACRALDTTPETLIQNIIEEKLGEIFTFKGKYLQVRNEEQIIVLR